VADPTPGNGQSSPSEGTPGDGNGHPGGADPMHGAEPHAGYRVCGAKTRNGGTCRNPPVEGRNRCRMHGGRTHAGGPGHHAATRGGYYSKLLPQGLRKTYDKVLADPETLNAAEEVALLRTRIGQLVSRLQTGETGSVWGDLQAAYSELSAVVRSPEPDPVRFGEAFKRLGDVINRGADIETVWAELYDVVDQKTTVAAREHKRMVDLQAYITSERALALITAIMHSVVRNVPDLQARTRISHDVRALITRGEQEEAPPNA
jgi:hypothetical protein